MVKNVSNSPETNKELARLYNKLELSLFEEQPNPYIALAAVEILKHNILEFLKKGKTSDISPNYWFSE